MKGPSELHPVFTVSLNGFAIDLEKVVRAVACVQDFVRHHLFTPQRNFFCETGISMQNNDVNAADAVWNSAKFDPWGAIGVEAGPVIADLKSCRDKILSRRKAVKDTRQRCCGAETVASSAVVDTVPRTTVRLSDDFEVGGMQYLEQHDKLDLPCCSQSASSPGKSKKRREPVSPGVAKNQFFVESPSASRPSFESALEKSFEKSGARRSSRDRRDAPVVQRRYH